MLSSFAHCLSKTTPVRKIFFFLFLICFIPGLWAQQNSPEQMEKPYVILVSLDGFRYDYVERFQPPHLLEFIQAGVQAESMIPSYPSKTFPNHYSIATGMYPENHGLVANSFFDPEKDAVYKIGDRQKVEDGSWYKGTPLWVNAEQNGMVAASYFFVGSEADIQGVLPSYYFQYEHNTPNEKRVNQALQWLKLPEEERPHLITMYFSDMDDTGHRVGPNEDTILKEALFDLDKVLGKLFKGVQKSGLPVNIILVSDHGMLGVQTEKMIPRESIENDQMYRVVDNGAFALLYLKDNVKIKTAYRYLKRKESHFKVYRRENFPYYQADKNNPRLGDLIVLPDFGYYLKSVRSIGMSRLSKYERGEHGFPPEYPEMHAIFYANGPAFKEGQTIPTFQNIHVYPLICKILDLPIPKDIDGDPAKLEATLKKK